MSSKLIAELDVRELEGRVLGGSGLGVDPHWGNGQGAERIRHNAMECTRQAIAYLHQQGAKIAPPEQKLLAYIAAAATFLDKEEWNLSRTWQVTSDVARAHIDMGHAETDVQRKRAFDACVKNMDQYYGLVDAAEADVVCCFEEVPSAPHTWDLRLHRRAPSVVYGIAQRTKTPPGAGPFPAPHELIGLALMRKLKSGRTG